MAPKRYYRHIIAFLCSCISSPLLASHLEGGEMNYKYLGDTAIFGVATRKYEITVILYNDCLAGEPTAIAQDSPLFLTIFDGNGTIISADTTIFYSNSSMAPATYKGPCGQSYSSLLPPACMLMKTFSRIYYLPVNSNGYTITNQRCCRAENIGNLLNPGTTGITYFCTIPGTMVNSSAIFNNYSQYDVCTNTVAILECSATDADGDSLSYSLAPAYDATNGSNTKPHRALPPPYTPVNYLNPCTYANPLGSAGTIQIDAQSGKLTVTPALTGRWVIVVACDEWRHGVLINTTRREFFVVAADCAGLVDQYHPYAGEDIKIIAGNVVQLHGVNGKSFSWSPGMFLSDPNVANPEGHFTEPGIYSYVLTAISDSGCTGNDTLTVTVLPHSEFAVPNAFTPNEDYVNDWLTPLQIGVCKLKSFEIFNRLGNRIFSSPINGTQSWDGNYNGKKQDPGVYIWQLTYTDNTGTEHRMSGNVLLLR